MKRGIVKKCHGLHGENCFGPNCYKVLGLGNKRMYYGQKRRFQLRELSSVILVIINIKFSTVRRSIIEASIN